MGGLSVCKDQRHMRRIGFRFRIPMSLYRPGGYPYPCKIVTSEDFAVYPLSCIRVGALEPGDNSWHGRVHQPG